MTTLWVDFGNHDSIFVKLTESTPMHKLMRSVADRQGIPYGQLVFIVQKSGHRLQEDDTVSSLGLNDNDRINAMSVGG